MSRNRALAVLTGAVWTICVAVVGTQASLTPEGAGYDAANRGFTLALVLFLGLAISLRRTPPLGSRLGANLLVGSASLLLAGNVLEFWGVLLSGRHTEKTAHRLGDSEVFWGSPAGWVVFLAGLLAFFAALAVLAVAAGPRVGVPLALAGLVGMFSTGLWAVSAPAAAAGGLVFGVWLVWLTGLTGSAGRAGRPRDAVPASAQDQ